ncbi:MAG: hypothetical protein JNK23_13390 [Opitutaceae bacterium]|nr:hypothetical protein [Opitutaceae bacterium]
MFRPTLAVLALAASALAVHAQSLHGKVEGKTYHAPNGLYKIAIPVLPELGGEVTDTPNVVTFQDDFTTHVSIAAFPQDATQRWELSTRGLKDYLIYFFSNFVLADFKQNFDGVQIESAKFVPGTQEGSLLTYLLVPGGSMFGDRIPRLSLDRVPVAKRGNLVFVRNGHIFVISTELAERAIEGKSYDKKTEEEDEILRNRLLDLVSKITFAKAPAADATKK